MNSIGIRKWACGQTLELVASVGDGDGKLTLFRRGDGLEAIETNGDPVFEGDTGFEELREQIVG